MPALLAIEATANSVSTSRKWTQLSARLLAPPPKMISSGENSLTISTR